MLHRLVCYEVFRVSFTRDFNNVDQSADKLDLAAHYFRRLENIVKFIIGIFFEIEAEDIKFSKLGSTMLFYNNLIYYIIFLISASGRDVLPLRRIYSED